jgi:hypothetical protein
LFYQALNLSQFVFPPFHHILKLERNGGKDANYLTFFFRWILPYIMEMKPIYSTLKGLEGAFVKVGAPGN